MLWVIAGKAVNHTLSSLFDPPWVLPLVIFVCWAIACGPISLFRVVRQKYFSRPITAPVFGPPRRPRRLLPALLLLPSLALTGLGAYKWKHLKRGQVNVNAHFPASDTSVPLVIKNDGIFVMASLNGTETLCQIDTGSDTVQWQRNLRCIGVLTGERGQTCDPQNTCVDEATVILPHIQIGTFEVSGLPTMMQDTYTRTILPCPRS